MKSTSFFVLAVAVVTSGCTTVTPTEASKKIKETDEAHITSCKFLGLVRGTAHQGGLFMQEKGKQEAQKDALNKAADLVNSTHVVWQDVSGGYWGGRTTARVYNCQAMLRP
jgi:hypothetical protein